MNPPPQIHIADMSDTVLASGAVIRQVVPKRRITRSQSALGEESEKPPVEPVKKKRRQSQVTADHPTGQSKDAGQPTSDADDKPRVTEGSTPVVVAQVETQVETQVEIQVKTQQIQRTKNESIIQVQSQQPTASPSPQLIEPLLIQEPIISPRKRQEQEDLQVLTSKISLTDIISGERIKHCCKTTKCHHLGCFDFDSFVKINSSPLTYNIRNLFEKAGQNDKEQRFYIRELNPYVKTFQILKKPSGKFHLNNRKFTLKRTFNYNYKLKCPLCDIGFTPSDLVFDDFMHLLINHPFVRDAKQVEIDDNWVVNPVKEAKVYEQREVVEIEDLEEEDDEDDDLIVVKRTKKTRAKHNFNVQGEHDGLFLDDDDGEQSEQSDEGIDKDLLLQEVNLFLANGTETDPVILD